ncbi:hypothetical protein PUV54_13920 [Hyphococcus flavus]|uniref:Transmembrane protein (PGPGW) n=1 Tax=Hyphococcus flavus TaxID=1866326 RepID=A0AAF0CF47_9PROT|nr:hypothetical protein [Hyphococcus flavus]WDI31049.1 hypothetical protein PUV54_13920 [Hyphococcus flavus]
MIARIATTIAAILLAIYGIFAAISPLPFGVPLVVLALIMFAAVNPSARPLVLWMRRRWKWFDYLVRKAADRSPARFNETFQNTDPANHPQKNRQETENRKN